ncbi:DUF397 domain-containing protein [Streptomyces albidoflavus]|uniref:DUF397 domain-containing protein n=1 Tax=Streptomyces wadayamensis TaxID=141454 RepID=A0ABR4S6M8_9ACTN|nr:MULTISPECIES: DUF397 domain-containing protein [Streptomyces]KDR61303.1 hypothetical protein DC60_26280 [Streptomyces wadayamensis]MCL6278761.1 DUF397 domain-containing protein [Streptomyces albidoflavus]MCX4464983.1 DUF397 domain-containing protein [Streptomyces albidoflavus]QXQ26374.1 DUF397 domain-containing protein [Streptomyces albidoflavus]QXQ32304.1 DUF397 domain-containing protein [Streptomyces albidoflavus]
MTTGSFTWFKSSYSANGGQCVEVAADLIASHGVVPVRDSKIQSGPVLVLPVTSFSVFVAEIKAGAFPA